MATGDPSPHEPHQRSNALDVALVVWPSFLAACVASLLFFAVIDPELMRDAGPRLFAGIDREAGYAVGFFFFWGIGALASTLSVYLIRTDRPARRGRGTS